MKGEVKVKKVYPCGKCKFINSNPTGLFWTT